MAVSVNYHRRMSSRPADAAGSAKLDGDRRPPSGSGWKLRVVRNSDELPSVREAWLGLQGDEIVTDPDFFEVTQLDPAVVRPHVIVLERDDEAKAMLVARIEELRLRSRLGYPPAQLVDAIPRSGRRTETTSNTSTRGSPSTR